MPLTAECLEHLHLKNQPFAPGSREAFLYKDTLLDSQIEHMLRALEKPGAILLLSASSQAGRSTQLMRLLSALPKYFEIIAFRGRNNTSFASVDVTIRKHLQARGDNDPDLPINDLLIARSKRGIDVVIAVDDAHLLGSDILRQLLNLGEDASNANSHGPRLLLMGDAVLGRNYQRVLVLGDNRQVQHINLAPFNQEQTAAYLRHRLAAAGNADVAPLFKPEVIANLHKRSRGLPGELNKIAEEWLSDHCNALDHKSTIAAGAANGEEPESPEPESPQPTEEPRTPDVSTEADEPPASEPEMSTDPEEAPTQTPDSDNEPKRQKAAIPFWKQPWFVPTAAGIGLGAAILSIALNPPDSEPSLPRFPLTTKAPDQAPERPPPEIEAGAGPEQGTQSNAPDIADSAPGDDVVEAPNGDPTQLRPPNAEGIPEELLKELVENMAAERADATLIESAPPEDAEVGSEGGSEIASGPKASAPPAIMPEETPASEEGSAQAATAAEPAPPATGLTDPVSNPAPPEANDNKRQKTTPETPSRPDSARPADAPPKAPAVYQKAHTRADLSWLAEQDPNHLTIQLIALQKVAAVEDYLNTHQLEGANIIPTRSAVIAVFGSFPDMASTLAALATIPHDMLAQGYWIRAIVDVQKDVR